MMNTKLVALTALLLFLSLCVAALMLYAVAAYAEPAPWSLWKNRLDGRTHCAQSSPGKNWDNMGGTFRDPRCQTAQGRSIDTVTTTSVATQPARAAPTEMNRKSKMLELMSIFVTARSSQ